MVKQFHSNYIILNIIIENTKDYYDNLELINLFLNYAVEYLSTKKIKIYDDSRDVKLIWTLVLRELLLGIDVVVISQSSRYIHK